MNIFCYIYFYSQSSAPLAKWWNVRMLFFLSYNNKSEYYEWDRTVVYMHVTIHTSIQWSLTSTKRIFVSPAQCTQGVLFYIHSSYSFLLSFPLGFTHGTQMCTLIFISLNFQFVGDLYYWLPLLLLSTIPHTDRKKRKLKRRGSCASLAFVY
jgi:hypothetical protein